MSGKSGASETKFTGDFRISGPNVSRSGVLGETWGSGMRYERANPKARIPRKLRVSIFKRIDLAKEFAIPAICSCDEQPRGRFPFSPYGEIGRNRRYRGIRVGSAPPLPIWRLILPAWDFRTSGRATNDYRQKVIKNVSVVNYR